MWLLDFNYLYLTISLLQLNVNENVWKSNSLWNLSGSHGVPGEEIAFSPSTSKNHLKCIMLVIPIYKGGSKANTYKRREINGRNLKYQIWVLEQIYTAWSCLLLIFLIISLHGRVGRHSVSAFFQLLFIHLYELKKK